MTKFIIKLLDSRPHQSLLEYKVEWNDGSISWVTEEEYDKAEFLDS